MSLITVKNIIVVTYYSKSHRLSLSLIVVNATPLMTQPCRIKDVLGFDGIKVDRMSDKLCGFISPVLFNDDTSQVDNTGRDIDTVDKWILLTSTGTGSWTPTSSSHQRL